MPAFIAIIRTDPAGGFDVSFPDMSDLKAHAATRKNAPDAALAALLARLQHLHAAGEAIPIPGTLELSGNPDDARGEAILVEV